MNLLKFSKRPILKNTRKSMFLKKNVFQTSIFYLSNFEVLIAMQTCPLSANKMKVKIEAIW